MTASTHFYRGRRATLATMHRKETAIAGAMQDVLGLGVQPDEGFDSDAFGTFDGRVPRLRSMLETALAKARAAMARANEVIGIASEGSYGPHPAIPFVPGGIELMVFVDDELGLVVSEHVIEDEPCYASCVVRAGDDLSQFLTAAKFPGHAVAVAPAHTPNVNVVSDLRHHAEVRFNIETRAALSQDGKALLFNDMRADRNPTRMRTIARLAHRLANRVASSCPRCGTPGFGRTGVARHCSCESCGSPTTIPSHDIHRCASCGLSELHERPAIEDGSSPRNCPFCNP